MGKHAAVWGEAIRAAAGSAPASDRELLNRFNAGEQAAFAVLFRRHAGMVLGVCRRALPRLQDAEDACQATFLVLARKAGSGRWQPSVANWLYLTARRVARNARLAADRRARHERKAAVPEVVQPVDRMTGRELLAALDAELDHLQAAYREPLVLCYLEGLTRDEAALRLGVPPATLKSRLERGRKRLGDALTRRGCAAGAGLLALAATSSASTAAPRLAEGVLAAASGQASPAVATLARGGGLARKALLVVLALSGAAVLGIGAWLPPTAADPPAKSSMPAAADRPAPAPEAERALTFSGKVVEPDGKPVAGARVVAYSTFPEPGDTPIEVARTAGDGTFRCSLKPPEEAKSETRTLVARAPGFAADWVNVGGLPPDKPVTLRLVPDDVTIRGRVVDLEGKPVAGATVTVRWIYRTTPAVLTEVLARWRTAGVDDYATELRQTATCAPAGAGLGEKVVADRDGRFEIKGVGRGRLLGLLFEGNGIETAAGRVVLLPGADPRATVRADAKARMFVRGSSGAPDLYGPEFTHVAKPDAVIRGVVTDAKTGTPVSGVRVSGSAEQAWWENQASTKTGADGRYRLTGVGKALVRRVWLFPGDNSPYLMAGREFRDTAGLKETTADFQLVHGVVVTGRVADKATGDPVRGATVYYTPLAGNPFFATTSGAEVFKMVYHGGTTDKDGTFRLMALPGLGIVTAAGELRGGKWLARYMPARIEPADEPRVRRAQGLPGGAFLAADQHCVMLGNLSAYKIIDPPEGAESLKVEMRYDPGKKTSGKVLDPDGKPAVGALAYGLEFAFSEPRTLKDGTFTAVGLDPQRPRTVAFVHPERRLAGAVSLTGDEKEPPAIRLRPWAVATGRVVDTRGKPRAGLRVTQGNVGGSYSDYQPATGEVAATTDAGGRFRLDVPFGDVPFQVWVWRAGDLLRGAQPPGEHKIPPGQTRDVGDVVVQAD